jgi:hypothetical protein
MPGRYVAALPEKVQHHPEWQTAAEMLMLAAEGKAPLMFAHIAMLKALHVGKHLARFTWSDTKCRHCHRDSSHTRSVVAWCRMPPHNRLTIPVSSSHPPSSAFARNAFGKAGTPFFVPVAAGEAPGERDGNWPLSPRRLGSLSS